MGLFEEDEIKTTVNPDNEERFFGKAFPIIKLFRELTANHPEHYRCLEIFPIDMIHAMLRYLVNYRGLDGRKAVQFKAKYLDPALSGADLKRTLFNMGEEKFDEMVDELFSLAAPYIE